MEPTNEPSLEESIAEVMDTLPPVLQSYLGQGKYSAVARQMMEKYGLHVDQAAILEREIAMLLMGIEDPNEFANNLQTEAAIPAAAVQGILGDLNQLVFMPLQEQMRKEAQTPKAPAAAKPQAAVPSYKPPMPQPAPRVPSENGGLTSVSAPLLPKVVLPKPIGAVQLPAAPSVAPAKVIATPPSSLRDALQKVAPATMPAPAAAPARSINILATGPRREQPAPAAAVPMPAASIPRPAAAPQPMTQFPKAAPQQFVAPTNLPGAMPPIAIPTRPTFAPMPPDRTPPPAPPKPYSTDPYREPIE